MNYSPPANPLPIGTRVVYIGPFEADLPSVRTGCCGVTRSVPLPDGDLVGGFGYEVAFECGSELIVSWSVLVPIAPPDEGAEPRQVEAPKPEAVPA